jgi:cytochrome P450
MDKPDPLSGACPRDASRDDRKSARLAAENLDVPPGAAVVRTFAFGREILRSPAMRQAIALGADRFDLGDPETAPVIFLDGEPHRRKRTAIAKFFTPKAVETRHRSIMERVTDELLTRFQAKGVARLDEISLELAVAVASEIVGLTESSRAAMARRISSSFSTSTARRQGRLGKAIANAAVTLKHLRFFYTDVRPAIRARRKARRDDVISQLLDQGASEKAIMIECTVYASAGMVTTREFIVMAAWHLFGREDVTRRFLDGDEDAQTAILEEILRLEPVAGMLYRKAAEDVTTCAGGPVKAKTQFVLDIRAANGDEAAVGACPYALDPDRGKSVGSQLSFGDGPHRCPGAQVALQETRIFLDRLLRLPGIRLERAPDMVWNGSLMSYELRNAVVACEGAGGEDG